VGDRGHNSWIINQEKCNKLLTVDCRRRGQKNKNCANYLLAAWFDFTPDDETRIWYRSGRTAGIDITYINIKNWKIWCFLTELTAFLCCVQVAVFAKIAATQFNGKTEIFRHQLVAAQDLQSAGFYRPACNTLLSVLERVTLIVWT